MAEDEATNSALPVFGTELAGRHRYRLMKRLGKGAFGSVFLARCLDAPGEGGEAAVPEAVAVKILSQGAAADRTQLLRRELSALLALRNDRIPTLYDWRLDGAHPFVAIQHYPAGDLRELLASEKAVDEATVWRLLADLLSALVSAHRASILHLDVKPGNVLLDGKGGFVLTDFGVSQAARMRHGILSTALGTPGYQAPEQKDHEFDRYDVRTDLWGVGATAWSVATGMALGERLRLVRDASSGASYGLPPVSEFRIYCSPALEDVIMSMLVIEQSRRPGSAAEVLARVKAQLDGGLSSPLLPSRRALSPDEVRTLLDGLVDPFYASLCREHGLDRFYVAFEDGDRLCTAGDQSYHAFLLLRGRVRIERDGHVLDVVSREGAFLGEVAALSGRARTASMVAEGPVIACVFNSAELEELVTRHPAVGTRLLRALAERLANRTGNDR